MTANSDRKDRCRYMNLRISQAYCCYCWLCIQINQPFLQITTCINLRNGAHAIIAYANTAIRAHVIGTITAHIIFYTRSHTIVHTSSLFCRQLGIKRLLITGRYNGLWILKRLELTITGLSKASKQSQMSWQISCYCFCIALRMLASLA